MRCREIIARQILRVLRDLGDQKPKLTGIEFVRDENGIVTGYRFEVKSERERPELKLIPGRKAPSPSS